MCSFFFKQKTAYELRISDWSLDVCSSCLLPARGFRRAIDRLAAGVTIDFAAVERGPYGFLAATGPTFEQDGLLAGGELERRIAVVVGWAAKHAIRSEARRGGKGWVSTGRLWWAPYN